MSIVSVSYSPGFQSDLTSWSLSVSQGGKVIEEYAYFDRGSGKDWQPSYHTCLDSSEFDELMGLIRQFECASSPASGDVVFDGAEQIAIQTPKRSYAGQATTLAWMASRGHLGWEALTPHLPVLRLYEFFRGRLHYKPFAGIDCRPFMARTQAL